MADDAFHELQLSGKQLVFLFMAATVVATVIFLSGVMVGRGVRDQRGEIAATETDSDPTAANAPPLPAPVGGSSGTSAATRESLTYPDRLAADAPSPEVLKEPEVVPAPVSEKPAARPPEKPAPPARTTAGVLDGPASAMAGRTSDPTKQVLAGDSHSESPTVGKPGFTVQVAAIKERNEADRIAKRLVAKGFPAYVNTP